MAPATSLELDRYVLETLMPDLVGHDRRPAAFIVYLALWARTTGARDRAVSAPGMRSSIHRCSPIGWSVTTRNPSGPV